MLHPSLRTVIVAALPLLAVVTASVNARAAPVCRAGQDDRVEHPAPDALLPRLGRTFGIAPGELRGTSFVRCASGRLMGCRVGANLACGAADVSRRSAGGDAFCRDNPGSPTVPMVATGHDTIYDWHCTGTRAVAGRAVETADRLGFIVRNWRPVR